nr:unnamed protein product [Digitaria exilis]
MPRVVTAPCRLAISTPRVPRGHEGCDGVEKRFTPGPATLRSLTGGPKKNALRRGDERGVTLAQQITRPGAIGPTAEIAARRA